MCWVGGSKETETETRNGRTETEEDAWLGAEDGRRRAIGGSGWAGRRRPPRAPSLNVALCTHPSEELIDPTPDSPYCSLQQR